MKLGARYFDEDGYITGGTGTFRLRDKDSGEIYDFATDAWLATLGTDGVLTEDATDVGYYTHVDIDVSEWGTRRISFAYLLTAAGKSPQAKEEEIVIIGGQETTPVNVPVPILGQVNVVLYVRDSAGAIPATAPTAFCKVMEHPTADYGPVLRLGAWDAINGVMVWQVPINCVIRVGCVDVGILGEYDVETAQVIINTAVENDVIVEAVP